MIKVKKTTVRRTKRTNNIIFLEQRYEGKVHDTPKTYNSVYANVLRKLADKIESVENAWVDPEVVIWLHEPGRITAQVMLSDPE